MQRHNVPFIDSRICASVGCGFLSSIAFAVMICPFWQNPHCGACSSIQACWSGCNLPFEASPSSVVISPLTEDTGMMQERTAAPLMITVQEPTLAKSASKLRSLQYQVIAENIEQRRREHAVVEPDARLGDAHRPFPLPDTDSRRGGEHGGQNEGGGHQRDVPH